MKELRRERKRKLFMAFIRVIVIGSASWRGMLVKGLVE